MSTMTTKNWKGPLVGAVLLACALDGRGVRDLAARQPKITGVRGRGLLVAVDLTVPAKTVALAAEERGYLVNAVQEQSLRFAPPFIVTREELAGFIACFAEILESTPSPGG